MKKIALLILLALGANQMFAQSPASNFDMYKTTIGINEKALAFGLAEAEFEAIKDDAYVNPEFVKGTIFQGENPIKTDVAMRFNAFADEIEIQKSPYDENYVALVKDPNIFVKMGSDIYVFVPYQGSNEKGGYFNVLLDGKNYDLYKKVTSTYTEPKKATTSYGRDTPASFTKNTTYYLVQDGTFLEMPSNKKKILKMMDSKKSEMKNYIKDNDIDLGEEADLIKAIKHFDSLL